MKINKWSNTVKNLFWYEFQVHDSETGYIKEKMFWNFLKLTFFLINAFICAYSAESIPFFGKTFSLISLCITCFFFERFTDTYKELQKKKKDFNVEITLKLKEVQKT